MPGVANPMHPTRCHFDSTVVPHVPELRRYAYRLTRSVADSDDLVQESLFRAYRAWARFETGGSVRAWLRTIALNVFRSGRRSRAREARALDVERDDPKRDLLLTESQCRSESVDGGVQVQSLGRGVQQALASLRPDHRRVVLLADVEDMTYQEIADRLGCPVGTVMSRLHRGRRALAQRLNQQPGARAA